MDGLSECSGRKMRSNKIGFHGVAPGIRQWHGGDGTGCEGSVGWDGEFVGEQLVGEGFCLASTASTASTHWEMPGTRIDRKQGDTKPRRKSLVGLGKASPDPLGSCGGPEGGATAAGQRHKTMSPSPVHQVPTTCSG